MADKKPKPYMANLVLKSDLYNLNSITTEATLENKFQICLTKLNSFETRGIALNDIKTLIALNKNNQKILRHYISSLKINRKSSGISNISKEAQAMIPGIISQEYKYNLYDPLDKPPNLIKTIERMLTQLREGYLLSNLQIQNAVADSYIKIFLYSMPKDDITLIFLVFFEPLINMINSGDNLLVQQGSALVIFKLIEFISKNKNIFPDKNEERNLLEIITKKYLNNFLKGIPLDNHYATDNLYLLMSLVKFDIFYEKIKDLYNKLINYLKYKEFNYQLKISVLKIFELIADNLLSSDTDKIIGYFQDDILVALNEKISDRIHKVQLQAREALNKWKKIEQIFLNEERQKENYFLDKDNSINEEELFPIEENKEININLRNLDNNTKNKKIKNNIKYMKNKEIKDAEKEDIKINNLNNNKKFINKYNNIDLNNNNRIKNENGLNEISLLKESLTKIISESVLNNHNYINNKIKSKLDIMEKRINNLENKISKLNNNNKKSNITLESQINNIWLECLELINQNKMNEAYDLILSTKDDIYLLRLMCLTGPVLNSLNENLAKNVLVRINMINRGKQINDILIKFVEESINNKNNIFKKLEYKEQNDILDSLFNIFKNKSNNNLTIKAQDLYNLIIEQSKQNNNQ
jgi:hypothetical protein